MAIGSYPLAKQVTERVKVAEALRHFFAFDLQVLVVHPVVHEFLAGCGFTLGYFVFVVGEHVVDSAAVDVEGFAQVFHAHGRAFDVPAWPAFAQLGLPEHVAVFRRPCFPKRKVLGFFFGVFVLAYPCASF